MLNEKEIVAKLDEIIASANEVIEFMEKLKVTTSLVSSISPFDVRRWALEIDGALLNAMKRSKELKKLLLE